VEKLEKEEGRWRFGRDGKKMKGWSRHVVLSSKCGK
jgi:hypothetical protein